MDKEELPKKVVVQLSEELNNRFKYLADKKSAAEQMLVEVNKERKRHWEKVANKHDLDLEDKDYVCNFETGKVLEQTSFDVDN